MQTLSSQMKAKKNDDNDSWLAGTLLWMGLAFACIIVGLFLVNLFWFAPLPLSGADGRVYELLKEAVSHSNIGLVKLLHNMYAERMSPHLIHAGNGELFYIAAHKGSADIVVYLEKHFPLADSSSFWVGRLFNAVVNTYAMVVGNHYTFSSARPFVDSSR